ncbi:MAG: DUF2192 domain-containing protein [Caldisphaeraceae archaeon]|nr:DUF2192 domain-containing protein [Caldisphaeraceae archaeon]
MRKINDNLEKRKSILMDLWSDIVSLWENTPYKVDRDSIVDMLKLKYKKENIEPIRGASEPRDLFDKELTSLYVLGKYGMGLEVQYPDLFDKVFKVEVKMDELNDLLLSDERDGLREKIKIIGGRVDGNTIARILRMGLTKIYFGFLDEGAIKKLSSRLKEAFPENSRDVDKYMRFYIAFMIAEQIGNGKIRNKTTMDAFKVALALQLNMNKRLIPNDKYIAKIANEVFKIPTRVVKQVLLGTKAAGLRRGNKKR